MLKEIKLNNFRIFKDESLLLGKYLTVIAGGNATGKSTILGMLGNCGELKRNEGSTYLNKQFRSEFSELFKANKQYDPSGSDRYEIVMCDENLQETDYRKFRVTWQSEENPKGGERFRLVPYHKNKEGKTLYDKFKLPVIYLGLSRLYPIGEATLSTKSKSNNIEFINEEHQNWYIEKYTEILSIQDEIVGISSCPINETDKKTCIGINTKKYDYLSNSAGQDNIGQILLALLSFKKLKEEQNDLWTGGLLVIDEIDASLHASAQEKLIDTFIAVAKDLGIQIVFTTHSLSLLEHLTHKTRGNTIGTNNNIEICYFTNANKKLTCYKNPTYTCIENDLLIKTSKQQIKIKVYTEDNEARWFAKKLLTDYSKYLDFVDSKLGCKELITLFNCDQTYFGNNLIIFDGDVTQNDLKNITAKYKKNYFTLPGNSNPESVFYEYLIHLDEDSSYWSRENAERGLTYTYFKEKGPNNKEIYKNGKKRDKYKRWFNEHLSAFEDTGLYGIWAEDNADLVIQFKNNFIEAYNNVADRLCLTKLVLQ